MQALKRRQFSGALLAGSWAVQGLSFYKDSALPVSAYLAEAARAAADRGEPLMLLANLSGCPFCERVGRNYLLPIRAKGLAAWQISVNDAYQRLLDFNAQLASGAALVGHWQIQVTPIVLLLKKVRRSNCRAAGKV